MNRILLSSILAFVLNSVSHGTPQRPDIILHNGIVYRLHTPLQNRTLPLRELRGVRGVTHIGNYVGTTWGQPWK